MIQTELKEQNIEIAKDFDINRDYNLIQNDAITVLPSIPDDFVDHCITDPPYSISDYDGKKDIGWLKSNSYWSDDKKFTKINENWDKFQGTDYDSFTEFWLNEIFRIVRPNGNLIIFGSYHNIYKIGSMLEQSQKKIINWIIMVQKEMLFQI